MVVWVGVVVVFWFWFRREDWRARRRRGEWIGVEDEDGPSLFCWASRCALLTANSPRMRCSGSFVFVMIVRIRLGAVGRLDSAPMADTGRNLIVAFSELPVVATGRFRFALLEIFRGDAEIGQFLRRDYMRSDAFCWDFGPTTLLRYDWQIIVVFFVFDLVDMAVIITIIFVG